MNYNFLTVYSYVSNQYILGKIVVAVPNFFNFSDFIITFNLYQRTFLIFHKYVAGVQTHVNHLFDC